MYTISSIVQGIMESDDSIKALASQDLLNYMAYARSIHAQVEEQAHKPVQLGSITAAVARYVGHIPPMTLPSEKDIQRVSVQTQLEGITYERSEEISQKIQSIYQEVEVNNKAYITITQGINEITIIAEKSVIELFRSRMKAYVPIYDITDIIGISVKFGLKYMAISNLFYLLIRKLAVKNINILEIVSTATELTFIVNKKDMQVALDQLQKGL